MAMEAKDRQLRREHNDRQRLAWQIAWLARTEKPPRDLAATLVPEQMGRVAKKEARQSSMSMKRMAAMIVLANGGKVSPKHLS